MAIHKQFLSNYERIFWFHGQTMQYFGILVVNVILTVMTLGLYYPWAKTKIRNFLWNETELKGTRFMYHGTGMELFRGFIIIYGLLLSIFFLFPMIFAEDSTIGGLVIMSLYIIVVILIPFAIFSAWRYRVTRTSWRGIYFSFDGKFSEFAKLFFLHSFFTIITLGIYFSWCRVRLQQYLFSHTTFGDMRLDFTGEGGELFGINLLGIILTPITLYIYVPFFLKNRFNFTINNTSILRDNDRKFFYSSLTGGTVFGVYILIFLLFLSIFVGWIVVNIGGLFVVKNFGDNFSFVNIFQMMLFFVAIGFATGWARLQIVKMHLSSIMAPDDLDLDNLVQNADRFDDAVGEDFIDALDIGLDF